MELNIIIGGEAGQGVTKASNILAKAFIKEGYYVFNYRDYQSLIRGGHNYNGLKISESPVFSHEEEDIDLLIAMDKNTFEIHKSKLKNNATVITDKGTNIEWDRKIEINSREILKDLGLDMRSMNIVLISIAWKIFGFESEVLKEIVKKELGEKNAEIVDKIFSISLESNYNLNLKKLEYKKKYYLNGSQAVAYGAIRAGIDLYIAYPMTPASPVLHILASLKDRYNFTVYHPDNEIGAINMALGASYAGARVMVGTSGGGFALMNEAFSMAGITEIPIVVYLAQRYDPASGMPTYTLQGDLKFALNAGHGEFPRIVIAPGDPSEAYKRTVEAFYLTEKYRVPVILMSDTYLAESHATFDSIEKPTVEPKKNIVKNLNLNENDFKYYEFTETGVSPRAVPSSVNANVRANSYEHDEYGYTTENPEIGSKMHEKRWRKIKYIEEEVKSLEPYKIFGKGNNLLVGWGSTKMPVLEALKKLDNFAYLHISYISPFPKEIKDILEKYERIILIENNVTGLLGQVIREQTGIEITEKILKYDGRPFTSGYIIKALKNLE